MNCAACEEKRLHTPAEWAEFHPLAGHGYTEGVGWSHPQLANERANERAAAADPPFRPLITATVPVP